MTRSRDLVTDAPLVLRVPEAAKLLCISRSAMYELVASGQVPRAWANRMARGGSQALAGAVVPRNVLMASRASVQVLQRHPSRGLLGDERLHLLGQHAMWVTGSGVQPRA
jgi:hypothetical protein